MGFLLYLHKLLILISDKLRVIKVLCNSVLILFSIVLNAQTPGNTLDFDGVNDHVVASLPSVFNNIAANDFTIEMWVKNESSSVQRIFFAQLNSNYFVSFILSPQSEPGVYVYNGGVNSVFSSTVFTLNQWTHLAFTWDSSTSTILMYVNGVLQNTSFAGTCSSGVNSSLVIGEGYIIPNFNGELDEFRIWNTVRSQCDISNNMNNDFSLLPPNLITYYNFNQGISGGTNSSVTTLNDKTSNYPGGLQSFSLSGGSSNWVSSSAPITGTSTVALTVDVQTACNSYTWINNTTYTQSVDTAIFIIIGGAVGGCDSIIRLDLTIENIDKGITSNRSILTSKDTGSTYQWIDCGSNTLIPFANSQSFKPVINGSYAVILTKNNCTDTSACYSITTVGLEDISQLSKSSIYPNPTNGIFIVDLEKELPNVIVSIINSSGQEMSSIKFKSAQTIEIEIDGIPGIYLVKIETEEDAPVLFKIIKQ